MAIPPTPIQYFAPPSRVTDLPSPTTQLELSCEPMEIFTSGSENATLVLILLVSLLTIVTSYIGLKLLRRLEQMTDAFSKCHSNRCRGLAKSRRDTSMSQDLPAFPLIWYRTPRTSYQRREYGRRRSTPYVLLPNGKFSRIPSSMRSVLWAATGLCFLGIFPLYAKRRRCLSQE